MPNHLHGILVLEDAGVGRARPISVVIGAFKAAVSKRLGMTIWQRNYWEHIIRSDKALNQIRQDIEENPSGLDTLDACVACGFASFSSLYSPAY